MESFVIIECKNCKNRCKEGLPIILESRKCLMCGSTVLGIVDLVEGD